MALDRKHFLRAVAWRFPAVFLLWLIPSVSDLLKFVGPARALAIALAMAAACLVAVAWVAAARGGGRLARWLPPAIGVALIVLFSALYPLATSGRFGGGSDRGDALDVSGAALLAGRPLYEPLTYLGNHPTPMPGAVLLALPFHLLGAAAYQNLLWIFVLVRLAPRLVGDRAGAAAYLGVFLLLCPGVLRDLVTGSDFVTNAIYVAAAVYAVGAMRRDTRLGMRLLTCLLVATALSSRPIYVVEAPIAAALVLRSSGPRRLAEFALVTAALVLAINGPIWLADPARFPLLLHANLLRFYPRWLHAGVIVPAVSLAIACAGFGVDLRRGRVWLLSALALAPMLAPSLLHAVAVQGFTARLGIVSGYALPLSLYAGLWLFRPPKKNGLPALSAPLLQDGSL